MKSRELIRILQELDPSGEIEVYAGNDILFAERLPGYYDGAPFRLVRDPAKAPYYDVVGFVYDRCGPKIQLHTHGLTDAVVDLRDVPVTACCDRCLPQANEYAEQIRKALDEPAARSETP